MCSLRGFPKVGTHDRQVGSPLVLPLLSFEGFGMVVGEWDSKSMGNDFFPVFFLKILKSHVFSEKVMFFHVLSSTR